MHVLKLADRIHGLFLPILAFVGGVGGLKACINADECKGRNSMLRKAGSNEFSCCDQLVADCV